MSLGVLLLILLALAVAGYVLGQRRAVSSAQGDIRILHSLPSYYGSITALGVIIPAGVVLILWLLGEGFFIQSAAVSHILPADVPDGSSLNLMMADVTRLAGGLAVLEGKGVDTSAMDPAALKTALGLAQVAMGNDPTPPMIAAA